MAKNKRIPSRSHPQTFIEANIDRKAMRKGPTRSEPDNIEAIPASAVDADGSVTPDPQVAVVAIPLTAHSQIFQSGLTYQDGDINNLPAISGFEIGDEVIGPNGNDCMVVVADYEGLHKVDVSTLMLNDRGQFSVWVRGTGSISLKDYEYVLSVHQDNDEDVDKENLVIRWEYDAGVAPSVLRLYPNLTVYPDNYIEIELDDAIWQDESWHKITATWNYQDQEWTLKWDDNEGVPTLPNTIAWPLWDEYTLVEIFTDADFTNAVYHYVAHVFFSPITDPEALGICNSGVTGEPTGFPNRTDSTLTFTNGTRLFEIDPVGDDFTYYINCELFTTTGDNVTITDDEGLHYIYYVDDVLTAALNPTPEEIRVIFKNAAFVAIVYWDDVNNLGIYVGEERHGLIMDGDTHANLHFTRGLQWVWGLGLTGINADQDGRADSHAQFGVLVGAVLDEDLYLDTAAATIPAGLNIYYRHDIAGFTRLTTEAGFSVKTAGTGRLGWNRFWLGAWDIAEVTNNGFVNYHIYATTEKDNPIVSFMGQVEYNNKNAAQDGAEEEINEISLGRLPTPEFRPLATVIFQTSNAYVNAVKARIVSTRDGSDYIDWRTSEVQRGTTISNPHSLDNAYDDGRIIDYSSDLGPVVMNFPDGGAVDTIYEELSGDTYNVRNQWIQANDTELLEISTLYYTESDGETPGALDRQLVGMKSIDEGATKYKTWAITSAGYIQGTGCQVYNWPNTDTLIHAMTEEVVYFNFNRADIDFRISSVNSVNMFRVDAALDSIGINKGGPSEHVELDINGSLALNAGSVGLSNGVNNDVDIGENSFIRIIGITAPSSITGFTDGVDGRLMILVNTTNQPLTIEHQNGGSGAWNRIVTGDGGPVVINAAGSCSFIYDVTAHRWRVIAFVL